MSQSMPPNYDERNREESISARVYREIKNKILQLDYLPGSYLTEARLAEEYGVSRMPVRIAIQKLSSEGWLLSDFRRKLRVKDVTQKSVQDLFSFREIIETRALQKIFEDDRTWEYSFLIEQKLLRMRAARDDYYEYMVADAEMHFELITVFDNDLIKDIYYPICDELVRIVQTLEGGQAPLEDTLTMWERGEALAARCSQILDGAQARLSGRATPPPPEAR